MPYGAPGDWQQYRCQSTSARTRQQCNRYALKGKRYCQFHNGRKSVVRRNDLSKFYRKHLGPTLKAKLDEFLNTPHSEQIQLYEELALARVSALEAIKLAEPALNGDKEKSKALALDVMHMALDRVKDLCLAASRIEKDSEDKVSLNAVNLFLFQIMKSIRNVVDEDIAQKIETEINENVRLPSNDKVDLNINLEDAAVSPAELAKQMDAIMGSPPDADESVD